MWSVNASVVPLAIRVPDAVTPKLVEWLQQIPETLEIYVRKSAILYYPDPSGSQTSSRISILIHIHFLYIFYIYNLYSIDSIYVAHITSMVKNEN